MYHERESREKREPPLMIKWQIRKGSRVQVDLPNEQARRLRTGDTVTTSEGTARIWELFWHSRNSATATLELV